LVRSDIVNFLENIRDQLSRRPQAVVLDELRPEGHQTATAAELLQRISSARAALGAAGLRKGDRCVLLAPNGIAWAALDLAAMSDGIIAVPLYTRQATNELIAMMRDAQPSLICCGDSTLRDSVRAAWPDAPPTAILDELFVARQSSSAQPSPAPLADSDIVTIIYTSGTSGEAKGVMLTVANVTHMLYCTTARLDLLMGPRSTPDNVFHYLPFCFAGSWILLLSCLSRSSCLQLCTDLTRLADDLRAAQPDYCLNVPQLLERMRTAVEAQLKTRGGILEKIFRNAQEAYIARQNGAAAGGGISLAVGRTLIFPTIR
jgi:long-chain acyl-CoA synthetase